KSQSTWGHSRLVAQAAVGIASQLGLDEPTVTRLRRAALVHDLGKVTVPCSALEKRENYSDDEWERMRLHAYYSERILSRVEPFKDLAAEASAHHEWLDGSGYHRELRQEHTTLTQRVLALADSYALLAQQAPVAPDTDRVLRQLESKVGTQFDPQCFDALAAYLQGEPTAASPRVASSPQRTSSLSNRELEVLRQLAKGLRNREISEELVISEKTVERHLENIYNKLDVTCRTSAVMYAVQDGIVGPA
ncbi:MAG: HD domain-containing phosphohydrolase, partial [Dehalococcoidia bacterium]